MGILAEGAQVAFGPQDPRLPEEEDGADGQGGQPSGGGSQSVASMWQKAKAPPQERPAAPQRPAPPKKRKEPPPATQVAGSAVASHGQSAGSAASSAGSAASSGGTGGQAAKERALRSVEPQAAPRSRRASAARSSSLDAAARNFWQEAYRSCAEGVLPPGFDDSSGMEHEDQADEARHTYT